MFARWNNVDYNVYTVKWCNVVVERGMAGVEHYTFLLIWILWFIGHDLQKFCFHLILTVMSNILLQLRNSIGIWFKVAPDHVAGRKQCLTIICAKCFLVLKKKKNMYFFCFVRSLWNISIVDCEYEYKERGRWHHMIRQFSFTLVPYMSL